MKITREINKESVKKNLDWGLGSNSKKMWFPHIPPRIRTESAFETIDR